MGENKKVIINAGDRIKLKDHETLNRLSSHIWDITKIYFRCSGELELPMVILTDRTSNYVIKMEYHRVKSLTEQVIDKCETCDSYTIGDIVKIGLNECRVTSVKYNFRAKEFTYEFDLKKIS